MKQRNLKLTALALAAIMLLSCLLVLTTAAQPAEYSSYANSGKRDELCLSLDGTGVSDYYTGSYTYDNLITMPAGSLKSSLQSLMKSTHTKITSYNDCRDLVFRVDCEQGDTSHATTLYTSYSMNTADWSPAWNCNREHVWPQSLGGGNTSGGGADLHHIRPAEKGVNSSRGNKPYGETASKGFYEPADHVKGDVARIILYVYVRWNSEWGATDVTEVFESVDILLAWCEMDPVDTWEMGRNEVVEDIQGNRNAFIDYPELAWLIFGRDVPEGMITPSGSVLNGEIPTASPDPDPEEPTEPETDAPSIPAGQLALFDFGANGGASHSDGTDITSAKSYTAGNYTLALTSPAKLYGGARDAKGNSCLKLGSSKAVGSFTFTVPADVDEVVIHAAGYKANGATVSVNGTRHTVNTHSNDGAYTPITVDTTTTKTVTVATVSGATRCMINTIEFYTNAIEPETETPTETPTEPVTEPMTEPVTESVTEPATETPTEAPTEPEETTDEPLTEAPTEESTGEPTGEPTEETTAESTPAATEPTETETEPDRETESATATEIDTTEAPTEEGCGSTLAGGAVIISILFAGVFAYTRRKKRKLIRI